VLVRPGALQHRSQQEAEQSEPVLLSMQQVKVPVRIVIARAKREAAAGGRDPVELQSCSAAEQ
jgi:hypothetical protein